MKITGTLGEILQYVEEVKFTSSNVQFDGTAPDGRRIGGRYPRGWAPPGKEKKILDGKVNAVWTQRTGQGGMTEFAFEPVVELSELVPELEKRGLRFNDTP